MFCRIYLLKSYNSLSHKTCRFGVLILPIRILSVGYKNPQEMGMCIPCACEENENENTEIAETNYD